jgi:hypothetical protein
MLSGYYLNYRTGRLKLFGLNLFIFFFQWLGRMDNFAGQLPLRKQDGLQNDQ